MKALLWKEARENVYKLATAVGAVLLLSILRQIERFDRGFLNDADAWAGAIGALTAVVLAMEVLAGERSRGTMEFLLVRPTNVGRILAAKFLVGATALFAVLAAFWAMVYILPHGPVSPWRSDVLQLLHDVSWLGMVYAWYLPMLVLYAIVFAASSATENAGEAAGAAAILSLVVVLCLGVAATMIPGFRERFPALIDFLEFIGDDSRRLLAGTDPATIATRTLITACFVGVSLLAAHAIVSRARQVVVGRKPLVIAAFVLGTLMVTLPQLRPERVLPIHPTYTTQLTDARDIEIGNGQLYAFQQEHLVVFDLADPGAPAEIGRVAMPEEGSLRQMRLIGKRVCGMMHRGTQGIRQSLVCFDVSDPSAPVAVGSIATASGAERPVDDLEFYYSSRRPGPALRTVGDILVIAAVDDTVSSLVSISVSTGAPTVLDSLVLERFEYEERIERDGYTLSREHMLHRHTVHLEAGERHLFLGWHRGLRVVEVGVDGTLATVADLDTQDRAEYLEPESRYVLLRDDTLFLDRTWPKQALEIDVSNPATPSIVATHRQRGRLTNDVVDGFYVDRGRGVQLFAVADPYPFRSLTLTLDTDSENWWTRDVEFHEGRAYALMGDQLAIFDMPGRTP